VAVTLTPGKVAAASGSGAAEGACCAQEDAPSRQQVERTAETTGRTRQKKGQSPQLSLYEQKQFSLTILRDRHCCECASLQ
jgi:hypothetical protein